MDVDENFSPFPCLLAMVVLIQLYITVCSRLCCRVRGLLHGAVHLPAGDAAQPALTEAGGRVSQPGVWEQQRGPRQDDERYSRSQAADGQEKWIQTVPTCQMLRGPETSSGPKSLRIYNLTGEMCIWSQRHGWTGLSHFGQLRKKLMLYLQCWSNQVLIPVRLYTKDPLWILNLLVVWIHSLEMWTYSFLLPKSWQLCNTKPVSLVQVMWDVSTHGWSHV